jgi:heterodisulfide reductase subunit A-like polyferredoxin
MHPHDSRLVLTQQVKVNPRLLHNDAKLLARRRIRSARADATSDLVGRWVDLLVIGSGAAGSALAMDQARAGQKVAVVERELVGNSVNMDRVALRPAASAGT